MKKTEIVVDKPVVDVAEFFDGINDLPSELQEEINDFLLRIRARAKLEVM